jgi:hypothetical protein
LAVGAGRRDDAAAGVVLRVGAHQQLGVGGQTQSLTTAEIAFLSRLR